MITHVAFFTYPPHRKPFIHVGTDTPDELRQVLRHFDDTRASGLGVGWMLWTAMSPLRSQRGQSSMALCISRKGFLGDQEIAHLVREAERYFAQEVPSWVRGQWIHLDAVPPSKSLSIGATAW